MMVNNHDRNFSGLHSTDSDTICTSAVGNTTSKADNGGPLVTAVKFNDSVRYYIIGVISQGNEKAKFLSSVSVQSFLDFIYHLSGVRPVNSSNNVQFSYSLLYIFSWALVLLRR